MDYGNRTGQDATEIFYDATYIPSSDLEGTETTLARMSIDESPEEFTDQNLTSKLGEVFKGEDLEVVLKLYSEVERLAEKTQLNELMARQIVKKFNELSGRIKQLEYQRMGISTADTGRSKSGPRSEILKDFDDAVTVLCNELLLMQSTIEAHKMQNSREKDTYETKFRDLQTKIVEKKHRMQTNGKYIWRITDYQRLFNVHKSTQDVDKMSITSAHFQTPSGHEFRLRAFLNGTGKGKAKFLSMFIQVFKSENDDILEYPFNAVIVFKVFDQSTKGDKKHHKLMFRTNNSVCFQRPGRNVDYTPENGLAQLLAHDLIHKPDASDGPVYLKNDTIFLGCEILPS